MLRDLPTAQKMTQDVGVVWNMVIMPYTLSIVVDILSMQAIGFIWILIDAY